MKQALKEAALAKTDPLDAKPGRFRANDRLLEFLNRLCDRTDKAAMYYPSARNDNAGSMGDIDSRTPHRHAGIRPLALLLAVIFQLPVILFFAPPKWSRERELPLTQLFMVERKPSLAPIQPTDRESPDWNASAADAARAAVGDVIRRESYQQLGPQDAPATPKVGSAPSVFETPKNKFGMVDQDASGVSTIWLSDNCYIQVGKSITPRASDSPPIPRCFVPLGRKKARGDLFKDMEQETDEPERLP